MYRRNYEESVCVCGLYYFLLIDFFNVLVFSKLGVVILVLLVINLVYVGFCWFNESRIFFIKI